MLKYKVASLIKNWIHNLANILWMLYSASMIGVHSVLEFLIDFMLIRLLYWSLCV